MPSIQQSACNALAKHLRKYLPSDVQVEQRWPTEDRQLPPKMVTILQSGPRRDIHVDPHIIRMIDTTPGKINTTYQIRACEQPLQLDIWAQRDVDRDELIAKLDDILNMDQFLTGNNVGNGLILKVEDGWYDTYADFYFESPHLLDTPDNVLRSEYRATLDGTVHAMLTVTRENAKQTRIRLNLALNGGSPTVVDIT